MDGTLITSLMTPRLSGNVFKNLNTHIQIPTSFFRSFTYSRAGFKSVLGTELGFVHGPWAPGPLFWVVFSCLIGGTWGFALRACAERGLLALHASVDLTEVRVSPVTFPAPGRPLLPSASSITRSLSSS